MPLRGHEYRDVLREAAKIYLREDGTFKDGYVLGDVLRAGEEFTRNHAVKERASRLSGNGTEIVWDDGSATYLVKADLVTCNFVMEHFDAASTLDLWIAERLVEQAKWNLSMAEEIRMEYKLKLALAERHLADLTAKL